MDYIPNTPPDVPPSTEPEMETLVAENFGTFAHRLFLKRHKPTGRLLMTLHEASNARATEYKAAAWLDASELRRLAAALMEAATSLPYSNQTKQPQ